MDFKVLYYSTQLEDTCIMLCENMLPLFLQNLLVSCKIWGSKTIFYSHNDQVDEKSIFGQKSFIQHQIVYCGGSI